MGFDVTEYGEQGDLAREGLALPADAPPERLAVLLTGEENLRLMADLRHLGRRRIAELLEPFDLTGAARKPLSVYSGGMRRSWTWR